MMCFDFPGGIGTASRRVGDHHVGVLLLCNFGDREHLDLLGAGSDPPEREAAPAGSCIAVCATDAPLGAAAAAAPGAARRCSGSSRAGSYAAEGSGEIGLAFATALVRRASPTRSSTRYFAAAWEAAQEAVYNCLVAATPGDALDGTMQDAFPVDLVRELAAPRERDGSRDEVVELARELIRIDTSNPPGNETPAARRSPAYLAEAGVECELVGPDPERLNLVARIEGAGEGPSLMLMAHTDVVPAPPDGWTAPARSTATCATAG